MPKPAAEEGKIIRMTLETVRSFYERKKQATTSYMSDDFMFIGANDFQWCIGLEQFLSITEKEYEELPVLVSDEEFHVLFHDRCVWVIYGRYKITAAMADGSLIHAHVRGTYVWRKLKGEWKIVHIHGSNAQDIPLSQSASQLDPLTRDSAFFDAMKKLAYMTSDVKKIALRDRQKNYRYLLPSDIIYLQAAGQCTQVYTKDENFEVWGLLSGYQKKFPQDFRRIHKSYLVNSMYIDSIRRYQATLKVPELELPIGKERYMELKRYLQQDA